MTDTLVNLMQLAKANLPNYSLSPPFFIYVMPSHQDVTDHFSWSKVLESFWSNIPTLCLSTVTLIVTWYIAKENRLIAIEQRNISNENKLITENKFVLDKYNKKIELLKDMNNLYQYIMLDFYSGNISDSNFEKNMTFRFELTDRMSILIANFNLYRSIFSETSYILLWETFDSLKEIYDVKSKLLGKKVITPEEIADLTRITNEMRKKQWTRLWEHLNKTELNITSL